MRSFYKKLMHLKVPENHNFNIFLLKPQHLFSKCDLFHVLNLKGIFFTNEKSKLGGNFKAATFPNNCVVSVNSINSRHSHVND